MKIDQIEYDVARGAMDAPTTFAKMREHVQVLKKQNAELNDQIADYKITDHNLQASLKSARQILIDILAEKSLHGHVVDSAMAARKYLYGPSLSPPQPENQPIPGPSCAEPDPIAELAARQRPLDPEIAKVLSDNMESLYEESPSCAVDSAAVAGCGGSDELIEIPRFLREHGPNYQGD